MTQQPYQPPPIQPWSNNPANQPGGGQQPYSLGYPQPGGYPPAQPQQAPPQYPTQPAYGTPPAPQGPPTPFTQPGQAGAPVGPDGDPFGNPGAPQGGGGDAPAIHQLEGRLLLIRPISYDPLSAGYKGGDPGPLARADVVVCDGEPIAGNLDGNTGQLTPFSAGPKVAPFFCGAMYIRGAVIPGQLKDYVDGRGFCLGRVTKGQPGGQGKAPWVLADPSEADKVIGRAIHAQWEQIKAAGQQPRPDQFGAPQGQQAPVQQPYQGDPRGYGQQAPPPGYGQQQPQGYPPQPQQGYPGGQAQNPYGAPQQAPAYPPY